MSWKIEGGDLEALRNAVEFNGARSIMTVIVVFVFRKLYPAVYNHTTNRSTRVFCAATPWCLMRVGPVIVLCLRLIHFWSTNERPEPLAYQRLSWWHSEGILASTHGSRVV